MPTVTCKHNGCAWSRSKPTKLKAEQALRMHEGRTHSGIIKTFVPVVSRTQDHVSLSRTMSPHRSKLEPQEMDALIAFICEHKGDYPTKTACFRAAVESVGVRGRLKENSVAVDRYFKKAALRGSSGNGHAHPHKPKRKYTRRAERHPAEPSMGAVVIKCCPMCGCRIDDVAKGIVQGKVERGEKL